MKVIIVLDFFKESMILKEVVDSIEKGFKVVFFDVEYIKIFVVDGGEGIVQVLMDVIGGSIIKKIVIGLLGILVIVVYGFLGDGCMVVIEMVEVLGFYFVFCYFRDLLNMIIRGMGELIVDAVFCGVSEIIIGFGGSVINDVGIGMVSVFGVCFLNEEGQEIFDGGGFLYILVFIDISGFFFDLKYICICVVCDVENFLIGENGVLYVFGL